MLEQQGPCFAHRPIDLLHPLVEEFGVGPLGRRCSHARGRLRSAAVQRNELHHRSVGVYRGMSVREWFTSAYELKTRQARPPCAPRHLGRSRQHEIATTARLPGGARLVTATSLRNAAAPTLADSVVQRVDFKARHFLAYTGG